MVIRDLCYHLLSAEPIAARLRPRALAGKTVVLMYHELAEDHLDIESWTVVRKSDFLRQLEHLRSHFDVVSLEDALAGQAANRTPQRPRVVITFDDGDRGNAEVLLPIVNELRLPVTVFVATRHVLEQQNYWFDRIVNALQTDGPVQLDLSSRKLGRYVFNRLRGAANWALIQRLLAELKALPRDAREEVVEEILQMLGGKCARAGYRIAPLDKDGLQQLSACPLITIGAHSHCHNILPRLDAEEAERSVCHSKHLLESWTGRPIWCFAYPNGDYDAQTVDIVRRAGFRCALATAERLWTNRDSPYAIPRMAVGRYDSMPHFKLSVAGGARHMLMAAAGRH